MDTKKNTDLKPNRESCKIRKKIKVKKHYAFHYQSFPLQQHRYLLKIDSTLEETCQQIPILAFRRN